MPSIIAFEDRAVAFVDILGFSALVTSATTDAQALAELQRIFTMMETTIPRLNAGVSPGVPPEVIPKHLHASDSIILSAPMNHPGYPNRGLDLVVMRAIQISHIALGAGYLVRGGIDVGPVWHSDANIVGEAYMNAYRIETKADTPRILLSERAVQRWGNLARNRMCISYRGAVIVNGLHEFYIEGNDEHGVLERTFAGYAKTVNANINNRSLSCKARAKWRWFKARLDEETEAIKGYIAANR